MLTLPHTQRLLRHLAPLLAALLAPFLLVCCSPAKEQIAVGPMEHPYLWEIKTNPPCYLYGTVHVPDARVLALPEIVKAAIGRTDVLYTEIPMDSGTMLRVSAAMFLPEGKTLEDLLPEDLYARVDSYLSAKGKSLETYNKFKIWGMQNMLVMLDFTEEMLTTDPLDKMLITRAEALHKKIGAIETVAEQIGVFESFTIEEQIQMLRDTLDELEEAAENGESPIEELLVLYLEGNLDALFDSLMAQYEDGDELGKKALEKLLWERNTRMAERIDKRLLDPENEGKSHFFAVGVAHYPRRQGLLSLLRDLGYDIERLGSADLERVRGEMVGSER